MQTFLPYPDFIETAKTLDNKRLGKQRVEAVQILNVLTGKSLGWKNHPAVKMWRGYEDALRCYADEMILEWGCRGFKNTMPLNVDKNYTIWSPNHVEMPKWLGDKSFHASHRSNLLRKAPEHYSKFEWKEPDNLPYIWPVK